MGRQRVIALAVVLAVGAFVSGCDRGAKDESEVLAIVKGEPVTAGQIRARLEGMPEEAREQFDSPSALGALVNREIEQRVWAEAAREAGLQKSKEFDDMMKTAETAILADLYAAMVQKTGEDITEDDIRAAYERYKADYSTGVQIHARHILCSSEMKAMEALEAVQRGMPFERAVAQYSEDSYTKDTSGDLGMISEKSVVPGLGVATDFINAVRKIQPGEVSNPIRTRRGYHIVQVLERTASGTRPLEEVRAQLIRRLKSERPEEKLVQLRSDLWEKYDIKVFDEAIKKFIGYPVTPEETMRLLMEATSPGNKIELCKQLVSNFPDNKYAPYAQFTWGFVLSEELHNYVEAEAAFRTVLERYPTSSFVEPAKWMIENMRAPHPPLGGVDHVREIARGSGG